MTAKHSTIWVNHNLHKHYLIMHKAIAVFLYLWKLAFISIKIYWDLLWTQHCSLVYYIKDRYDMHINILKNKKNMHCAIYKGFLDDPISKQSKSPLL